jgi:His-Xaa-Ser system protein HxsD
MDARSREAIPEDGGRDRREELTGTRVGCSCHGSLSVLDAAHVAVRVDTSIFSVPAILRASYKLTDRCYAWLDRDDHDVVVFLLGKTATDDVRPLVGILANELIDQQLREHLEHQFQDVRTVITAQAFAEGNLLDLERDHADYRDDPRGIDKSQ